MVRTMGKQIWVTDVSTTYKIGCAKVLPDSGDNSDRNFTFSGVIPETKFQGVFGSFCDVINRAIRLEKRRSVVQLNEV